jgi:hypothetical protein
MSLLGILGLLLGLVALSFASRRLTRTRFAVFSAACLAHIVAAYIYYLYVLSAGGDSDLYYLDELQIYGTPFRPGTTFVIYLVQWMRNVFGGTYLDYFFLFQAVGFWGIALLMRIFEEIYEEFGESQDAVAYLLLFLPGLHFWTAAVGKDSLLFFAIALALWAMVRFQRRQVAFGAAMVLMFLVRPHIAIVSLVALSASLLFARGTSRIVRFALILAAVAGSVALTSTIQSTYNVDVANADSVSDFFARTESVSQSAAAGNTVVIGSFAFRLFSLLFRPLFLDAEGFFGMVTSLENVALILLFIQILWGWRTLLELFRGVPFVRYALTSSLLTALLLAMVYYNVGLGLRQRTMFIPGILCLFVMVRLVAKTRRRRTALAAGYAE